MNPAAPSSSRWTELDGLRCIAIAGVLATHFSPGRFAATPWSEWGVRLFFVLSGFLITDGLLRRRVELPPGLALRDFFIHRALRLWPLYFAAVIFSVLVNTPFAHELLPWNLAFAANIQIYRSDTWPMLLSHFWTLAVEQQFYLLWPFLLLFVAPRYALVVVIAILVTAPLLRAWEIVALAPFPYRITSILLPMCADYLAWGALLAFLRRSARVPELVSRHGGVTAIGIFGLLYVVRFLPSSSPVRIAVEVGLFGFAAALLIAHCVGSHDSRLRHLLRLRPLVYLGTISYGIYVIHNFCHRIGPTILRRFTGKNYFDSEIAHLAFLTGLSICLAAVSWRFFEQPIARAGRRLLYAKPTS